MKRILLVRTDGIGDFVIFSAVLEEYRKVFDGYKIDILCRTESRVLAVTIPFVNRVIGIDANKLFRKKYILYYLFWAIKLKSMHYEKVICPVYSRNLVTDFIVKTVRSSEKIVFDGDGLNDAVNSRLQNNQFFTRIINSSSGMVPEIERNAEFINSLGGNLQTDRLRTKLWFKEEDITERDKILKGNGLEPGKFVCVFPGAGLSIRHWEMENWVDLVGKFLNKGVARKVVFLGGPRDSTVNDEILKHCDDPKNLVDLTGQLNLRILAKVIESAHFLISMETSAVHIAAAVGTPNICIIGGGHFGRFYPYGDLSKNRVVFKKMDCYGCNWKCIYETTRCIHEIEADSILKEAEQFI